jgi:hypothetical protein
MSQYIYGWGAEVQGSGFRVQGSGVQRFRVIEVQRLKGSEVQGSTV